MSEGDIITIFSQYGEPTFVKLVRDKETGKSKGFAFLKYEDQRSTDLAVDNLGGAVIMGRTLKIDHTRYKKRDDEEEEENLLDSHRGLDGAKRRKTEESEEEEQRPMIREEIELAKLIREHDDDDPMKEFLVNEKKQEVQAALAKSKSRKSSRKSKHRQHREYRRRDDGSDVGEDGHSRSRQSERHQRSRSWSGEPRESREKQGRKSRHGDTSPRHHSSREHGQRSHHARAMIVEIGRSDTRTATEITRAGTREDILDQV